MANVYRIALDSGHGLYTPGKRCLKSLDPNETREWTLNSRICEKIEEKLKAYTGYELLRVDDRTGATDVSEMERCRRANEFKANIYIAVHHDAGVGGKQGGGITAFVWNGADAELLNKQKILYSNLIKHNGIEGDRAEPLKKTNFNVLVWSDMEAILVENGFMDSSTDVPIILTDEYAEKTACGYVESLVQFGNLQKKPDECSNEELKSEIKELKSERATLIKEKSDLNLIIMAVRSALDS